MFLSIIVQQPQPGDIVGSPVLVAGIASGFEATVRARARDGNGQQLAATTFMCGGGGGEMGCFQIQLALPERPPTPNGFVEVFEDNAAYPEPGQFGGPVAEVPKVIVPVVFGTHLVAGFVGYRYRVVVDGDTLSRIADDEYGAASQWRALYEANRDQIGDPDLIFGGQRLRVPHYHAVATATVSVYFLDTERFAAATEPYERPVERVVSAAMPATGALRALFDGPTPAEQADNLIVDRSGATGFTGLAIAGGIARVRLVGGCSSGGSTYTIANQIVPTLKQFASVDHVKIYDPDGSTGDPDGPTDSIPACLNP